MAAPLRGREARPGLSPDGARQAALGRGRTPGGRHGAYAAALASFAST